MWGGGGWGGWRDRGKRRDKLQSVDRGKHRIFVSAVLVYRFCFFCTSQTLGGWGREGDGVGKEGVG